MLRDGRLVPVTRDAFEQGIAQLGNGPADPDACEQVAQQLVGARGPA